MRSATRPTTGAAFGQYRGVWRRRRGWYSVVVVVVDVVVRRPCAVLGLAAHRCLRILVDRLPSPPPVPVWPARHRGLVAGLHLNRLVRSV